MNREIAIEWVSELRSGKYQQTTGYLQNENGFCCLGVLCDMAVAADVIPAPTVREGSVYDVRRYGPQDATAMPPDEVNAWAGVTWGTAYDVATPEKFYDKISGRINMTNAPDDELIPVPEMVGLTALNDVYGANFNDIADAIEAQWVNA